MRSQTKMVITSSGFGQCNPIQFSIYPKPEAMDRQRMCSIHSISAFGEMHKWHFSRTLEQLALQVWLRITELPRNAMKFGARVQVPQ